MPLSLNAWTYATILAVMRQNEREPGLYDYKTVLTPPKGDGVQKGGDHAQKHLASIRRTACSMANADGGYILFGVQDRQERPTVSDPAERIVGISVRDDHLKQFQDKISVIQPDLYFIPTPNMIRLPTDSELGVFVVHIPRSSRRPHMDESTGIFYRRGSGGAAEKMRAHDVREQMINTEERLRKVTLFRLLIKQYRTLREDLVRQWGAAEIAQSFLRFDTSSYMPVLADMWHLLPPDDPHNQLLLQIPREADEINRAVDALCNEFFRTRQQPTSATNDSGERLNKIMDKCEKAEQDLARIFDPL